jgi:hypothetical protein
LRISPDHLRPSLDAVTLIRALGRVTPDQQQELAPSVNALTRHDDPDVQAEAVRVLGVRWKDQAFRPTLIALLQGRDTPGEVRQEAFYGLAATSTDLSRRLDSQLCLDFVCSDDVEWEVRAAAYDALLIVNRHAAFPTKQRAFDPALDIDWDWVREIRAEVGKGPAPPSLT